MKANSRAIRRMAHDDSAVSPVIAVILMVAITVVLAATVYVWVSGFSDTKDQAPNASFKVMDCDTNANDVVVKLLSGGPLQKDDIAAKIFHVTAYSEGTSNGAADPIGSSGTTWTVGDTLTLGDAGVTGGVDWDSGNTATFSTDNSYTVDFIHKPSQQSIASIEFTC